MTILVAPRIETPRLVLRAQHPADREALYAAFADNDFARFITRERRGLSREEAWRVLAVVPGSWAVDGYGQWMVEEKASGLPVGRVGPWAPEGWPDFEIGWSIFPGFQGRGYAVEAAAAAFRWVHDELGRQGVIHLIDPLNLASERVAAALGGKPTGSWTVPTGETVRIWTTRWEDFAATAAFQRLVAAEAPCS